MSQPEPREHELLEPLPLHAAPAALPPGRKEAEGFRAVLRTRDFRYLWAAQAASQLADKFLVFTLLVVVYDLSRSASTQSLLMIAYTLPSVALSAPAGVYADRHDKRALMVATNLLRGLLILLIPGLQAVPLLHAQAWPLILITFLFSAIGQVFAPAEAASIPSLVRRDQIMTATSLFMTTVILTIVLGVPAATLSVRLFGTHAPFYIAAFLFALATLSVWRVRRKLQAAIDPASYTPHVWRELREGVVIMTASQPLRFALCELTIALIVVFTVFALGPVYLATVLHRSPEDTYILLIPATFGLVGAAGVLGQQTRRFGRDRLLVTSIVGAGVALIATGVAPAILRSFGAYAATIPLLIALSVTFGVALGGLLIPAFSVLQEQTTEETRGRIFGGIFTVINAAVAIPLLLAGTLADIFGVDRVITGLGLLLAALGVAARLWLWPRLSVLEPSDK